MSCERVIGCDRILRGVGGTAEKLNLKRKIQQPIMGVSPPLVCNWLFIYRSFLCLHGPFVF